VSPADYRQVRLQQFKGITIMETSIDSLIIATSVPEAKRLAFLPRHFERQMMAFEQCLFTQMSQLSGDYVGGYWDFYDLSNGGCYLAPSAPATYHIRAAGNSFDGSLSADAAGITATLFALNALSFQFPRLERFTERLYQLRDFACEHAERRLILAAID